MTLMPLNLKMLSKRMTGGTGIVEVQGDGRTYFRNGPLVLSVDHLSDSAPGIYKVGDPEERNGEYIISALMLPESKMDQTLVVPGKIWRHVGKALEAHAKAAGKKKVGTVTIDIGKHPHDEGMIRMRVYSAGAMDQFGALELRYDLTGDGNNHGVSFEMDIFQLIDMLYPLSISGWVDKVELLYLQEDTEPGQYNEDPFFLRWRAFERQVLIGAQLADDDLPLEKLPPVANVDGDPGEPFLDADAQIVQNFVMGDPEAPAEAQEAQEAKPKARAQSTRSPRRAKANSGDDKGKGGNVVNFPQADAVG